MERILYEITWNTLTILSVSVRIIRSLVLGVERRQEIFCRHTQRQQVNVWILRLGLQRRGILRENYVRRRTQNVWRLGLGVESNTQGSLLRTSEAVGRCMWLLWCEDPEVWNFFATS